MIGKLKSNWRLVLLVVAVVLSLFVLFSPTMASSSDSQGADSAVAGNSSTAAEGSLTNLKYGIDLAGGTRVRAPLVGQTAEGVDIGDTEPNAVTREIANQLPDATTTDVIVRLSGDRSTATVEMVNPDVSTDAFATALSDAGYEYDGIRDGVTQATRDEAKEVLEDKVNQAGLSGATVQQIGTGATGFELLIEVPGQDPEDLISLIRDRGTVRVDIYHQDSAGEYVTERAVITEDGFGRINPAQENPRLGPHVPVLISEQAAPRVQQQLVETGVAQQGGSRCTYEEQPNSTEPCLLLVSDSEIINS